MNKVYILTHALCSPNYVTSPLMGDYVSNYEDNKKLKELCNLIQTIYDGT